MTDNQRIRISIHALRKESDFKRWDAKQRLRNFYPRSPQGERHRAEPRPADGAGISIHALRKESDSDSYRESMLEAIISIHALRKESDVRRAPVLAVVVVFLSTLSARRATVRGVIFPSLHVISIHALRKESDPQRRCPPPCTAGHFYPRSPQGERL